MESILIYSLKAVFSGYVLYLIYHMLMRNDTMFSLARYYLLLSLAASFVIPILHFPGNYSSMQAALNPGFSLEEIVVIPNSNPISGFTDYFLLIYVLVSVFMLHRFIVRLGRILNIYKNSTEMISNCVAFRDAKDVSSAFTFWNKMFLNADKYNRQELEIILAHESIHAKRLHNADILLLELLQIVFWFNPVLLLYKNALSAIHEFEADRHLLYSGSGFEEYGMLIIKESLKDNTIAFSNNFNSSTIKRRITMMKRKDSGRLCRLKPLAGLAFAFIIILMFNLTDVTGKGRPKKAIEKTSESAKVSEADKQPQCDMAVLSKNVVYPEAARKEGLTCTVFVKAYVDENGKVTQSETRLKNNGKSVSVKKKSKYYQFTVAAMEAVTKTKFTPAVKDGKNIGAWVTIPIKFQLADK